MAQFSTNHGRGKGKGKIAVRMQRQGCVTNTDVSDRAHRRDVRNARTGGVARGLQAIGIDTAQAGYQLNTLGFQEIEILRQIEDARVKAARYLNKAAYAAGIRATIYRQKAERYNAKVTRLEVAHAEILRDMEALRAAMGVGIV